MRRRPATADERNALAGRALDSIRRVVRALRQAGHDAERSLGVTTAQLFVMRRLAEREAMSLSELAARAYTSLGSLSEVVARLVARRLVARSVDPFDRRRVVLSLSPAGRSLVRGTPAALPEILAGAFRTLSTKRQRAVAVGLERWLAAAGLEHLPASMFDEHR